MKQRKEKNIELRPEAIPHFFLVLGFFGAALSQEFVNIVHDAFKSLGPIPYFFYSLAVIVSFGGFIYMITKMIIILYRKN